MTETDIGDPKRTYILDTNVLIHDPHAPLRFEEHEVAIPMTVLEELDKLKSGQNETARGARQASRTLSNLLDKSPLKGVNESLPIDRGGSNEGTLSFLNLPSDYGKGGHIDSSVADNMILLSAMEAQSNRGDREVIVVSKDVNLRVKAVALGVLVEDYSYDNALDDGDTMAEGLWSSEDLWNGDLFDSVHDISASGRQRLKVTGACVGDWYPGMLVCDDKKYEAIVREKDGKEAVIEPCDSYRNGKNLWGVNARDVRQNFAINLLMDDEIDLVTLAGGAGTGKTFIAMAAALALVFEARRFERIIITRETTPSGEDIGFLPGTEEEKMLPWMRAFYDNIQELIRIQDPHVAAAAKPFIESRLEMRSMSFMRGRTLSDTLLILDEAQNLTPRQAKTLATRVGRNTKLICLGNVGQIDTPYLTGPTSGLTHLVQRFRGWPHAGHITLSKVERSRLADMAEKQL